MNTNENCNFFDCLTNKQKLKVEIKIQEIILNSKETHNLETLREQVAKEMFKLLKG